MLLNREDIYPYVQHFKFPWTWIQKAKTFVDAIVYLCIGPNGHDSIKHAIEYVRPKLIEPIVPIKKCFHGQAQSAISRPTKPMPSSSRSSVKGTIIVISDDSDEDMEDVTAPRDPPPPPQDQAECTMTIPTWVKEVLGDTGGNKSRGISLRQTEIK